MTLDFPPFGLHLVCAQMYLSSEKESNQLTSSRIVTPSLWFCLTAPGTASSKTLEAPTSKFTPGAEGCMLLEQPVFIKFYLI